MDDVAAIELLAANLPEFTAEDYGTREDGGPLFHLVMGDLYRFYEARAGQAEIERRLWAVVERLAAEGSDSVENAVAVSFIENFMADPESQRRFRQARHLMGPATGRIGAAYGL